MTADEKEFVTMEQPMSEKGGDSISDHSSTQPIDPAVERKLLAKIDLILMPILFLLFLVSFVDRTNIGNAKIEGLEASLNMKDRDYSVAVFIFNIPYVLLDIPSNLIMQKFRPSYWLGGMMFCWGLSSLGQGLTKNYEGLLACRLLIGIFEAGFVPGCALLIGSYYKRHEFQKRYSFFFSAAILAGAFGGLLAYLLSKLDGVGGLEGWRWIFLIEGILTCVIALVSVFVIPDWPQQAKFLKPEEKVLLLRRLQDDAGPSRVDHWSKSVVVSVLTDWKIWLAMIAYFGADNTAGSFAAFQPTILTQLGYTASQAQIHTIPVYMVALVCSLCAAYFSDRLKLRYPFCMTGVTIAIIGWAIQLSTTASAGVRYFGLFLSLAGTYILMPVLIVWLSNNMGGSAKRGFATAFQIGIGNCAAFVSSNSFTQSQAPKYILGYSLGLGLQAMSGIACTILVVFLWLENRRRDSGGRDDKLGMSEEELSKLGDDHPSFRYTL